MLTKEDKIIFYDSETYFHPSIKKPDQKYCTPTLRLLTWKCWDGEKFTKLKQIDTLEFKGDPWEEIRLLMSQGYRILGHNCLLPNTKILLSDGKQVNISSLVSEGSVNKIVNFNHKKTKTEIDTILNKDISDYEGDIVKIKTMYGIEIEATPEHPLFGASENEIRYFKSNELKKLDMLARPIQLPSKTLDFGYTKEDYYFAGLMLSDGSLHRLCNKQYFGNTDQKLIDWVSNYLDNKGVSYKLAFQHLDTDKHKKLTRVMFNSEETLDLLVDLGIPRGNKSRFDSSVDFSSIYLSSEENIISFLSGVIDGDGHIRKHEIQIACLPESMRDFYLSICMKLGLLAYKTNKGITIAPTSNRLQIINKIAESCTSFKKEKILTLKFDTRDFLPYPILDLITPFFRSKSVKYEYVNIGDGQKVYSGLRYGDIPFSRSTFNYIINKRVMPKRHWLTQIIDIIDQNISKYATTKQTLWLKNKKQINEILSFYWFPIATCEKYKYVGKVYNFGTNNENYIANGLLLHNCGMFDLQPSLTNHHTDKPDWIVPYLVKGQIWDTMCVDKLISGMNPDKNIDTLAPQTTDALELAEEEAEALEETETDGSKLRGFSLKVLVWKYCQIKLDKTFQEWKYYVPDFLKRETELSVSDYLVNAIENGVDGFQPEFKNKLTYPDFFYRTFSKLVIDLIKLTPEDKLKTLREKVFIDHSFNVTCDEHLIGVENFEDIGKEYLYCLDYRVFLERITQYLKDMSLYNSLETENKYALGRIQLRVEELIKGLDESPLDLNKYGKGGIVKSAIKYSQDDIMYLPDIYIAQKKQIESLQKRGIQIEKAIDLTHKLITTTFIGQKYGVPINVKDVQQYTSDYTKALGELEKILLDAFPKVSRSKTELIDLYTKAVWSRGSEICGIRTQAEFKKALKIEGHAVQKDFKVWVDRWAEHYKKAPKLGNYAHVKECLNNMGILVENTAYETLKDFSMRHEVPILDSLLSYKEKNALLTKTLTKFTPSCYLRPDNTVPTTYHFTGPSNWRSSSKNPNVQNLSRDLKSLFHTPPGMYNISYDLSAVELVKVVDQYKPKYALESFNFPDQHIYFAAMYNDLDPIELYDRYKNEDPEALLLRQSSKTVTYMNIYKSPCDPGNSFVTGVKKLQQIFKTELGIDLDDLKAARMILNCERVFDTWTAEKLLIESKIRNRYQQYKQERDPKRRDALRRIGYQGPLGHIARFYLDDVYFPEQKYVNARSIYSVLIAGFIAVGVKSSVKEINEFFFNEFGFDRARLPLTVHDSNTAYVVPEVFCPAREGYINRFLNSVYVNSEMKTLPLEIEGYSTTCDGQQVLEDGTLWLPEKDEKGKTKYKKEKYRITNDLIISKV